MPKNITRVWFSVGGVVSYAGVVSYVVPRIPYSQEKKRKEKSKKKKQEQKLTLHNRSTKIKCCVPKRVSEGQKHQMVSGGKTSSCQGRKTDRSTLKTSSLASIKVKCWKNAAGQGAKVPSPDF